MATLLLACGTPAEPTTTPVPATTPSHPLQVPEVPQGVSHLTPNPVEDSLPIYGGIIQYGLHIPISFDGHQKRAYGPTGTLPTFNQLVMFNINYKETVPENIIGDLADSWETSPDGTEITFHLHPGVKWHDGMPFTAADVVYSMDKMTDIKRSAIADWFPAYESSEAIDDNTVKVNLKYASASFMISLAAGESVIQAKHLAGTDDQSTEFMIGTGPFILEDYKVRVHLKWRRNPEYWKQDRYGNQLPYLDGIIFYEADGANTSEMLIGRRLDLRSTTTGAATTSTYEYLKEGKLPTKYFVQVQSSLYITGFEKWHFLSYYPGMKHLHVSSEELENRKAQWTQPKPNYTTGALAKYASLVGSAAEGAITGPVNQL